MVVRTVLDLRSSNQKFIDLTLLLAASWHRHGACDASLEVLMVGGGNPVLAEFLAGIGASHASIPPGRNDDFSRSSNKIEGAYPDPQGRRVLLLDNDVAFFGSIDGLRQLPATAIVASEAGNARISDAQWESIRVDIGFPLLRRRFSPVNKRPVVDPHVEDSGDGLRERYLYLNSGVVLFPAGHDHRELWRGHQRRIFDFFRTHALASTAVTTSDQAGFASSVAAYGDFAWLPLRFNYRHGCFSRALESPERIAIVHFTGDIPEDTAPGVANRMEAYWKRHFLGRIDALPHSVDDAEKTRRKQAALEVLESVRAIVRDYELDRWAVACRQHREKTAGGRQENV